MMNCSDPATYNQAAVRVMHAAAQSLQVSDATVHVRANQAINQINVNCDRVAPHTAVSTIRAAAKADRPCTI